jgi:hypothetical protein
MTKREIDDFIVANKNCGDISCRECFYLIDENGRCECQLDNIKENLKEILE